ncbi:MAG TPA: RIP metalloprotease RseP [Thermoanaerobaculia bacterium]|nr:RIP metalloprotease RseP [Thermoanaerobaculia bacterium]
MFANVPTNLIAFIIVLGFLVFAHEAGHFLFAKLFRVKVLVFSFGFGTRLFGFRKGDTDYRVSLIPLGGYVRMAGDNAEEEREGSPDEFLSKPKWQRFLILIAGPAINLVIAILFLALFFMLGNEVLKENSPVIGTVIDGKPAAEAGLRPGDRVVRAGAEPVETWNDVKLAVGLHPESPIEIEVLRGGESHTVTLTPERVSTDYGSTGIIGITPWFSTEIGRIAESTAAARAGLREGDRIVAVAGRSVGQMSDVEAALDGAAAGPVEIQADRDGRRLTLTLPAEKDSATPWPGFGYPTAMEKMGPSEAFGESVRQNWRMTRYIFITIGRLLRFEGSMDDFSGPVTIARISGEMLRTGVNALVYLMAVISLNLGILNLLPIPVLDGGHIAILGLEGVMRRDLSMGAKERLYKVGFALLAMLMIVVLYQDIVQNVARLRG